MDDLDIVTAFSFDSSRNCIVPLDDRGAQTPVMLEDRLHKYRKNSDAPLSASVLSLCHDPFWVPKRNVAQYKSTDNPVPVVMCPPPGYLTTRYNFEPRDEDDVSRKNMELVYLLNQLVARSWEMTRQTLEELGAKVIVADPIGLPSTTPYKPYDMLHGVYGLQVFPRDAGFIAGDTFYCGSTDVESETDRSIRERHMMDPNDAMEQEFHQEYHHNMGIMRDQHAATIIDAFGKTGVALSLQKIDSYLEAGDILFDKRKGCIFVGRETEFDFIQKKEDQLARLLADATGADIVQIDRESYVHAALRVGGGGGAHLDLFMAPLPNGEMLCDPRFTNTASMETLQKIYGDDLVRIGKDNPIGAPTSMGEIAEIRPANLVAVGQTLLMPFCSDALRQDLTRRKYTVVSSQTLKKEPSVFYMQGGSFHCITQTLAL